MSYDVYCNDLKLKAFDMTMRRGFQSNWSFLLWLEYICSF